MRRAWACVAVALVAIMATQALAEEGPYEDIAGLLRTATDSADGLAALDNRGPPRVVDVHHHHVHTVPHHIPRNVAQLVVAENTPAPVKHRVVTIKNRAQAVRHAIEDAHLRVAQAQPTVTTLDVSHTYSVHRPVKLRFKPKKNGQKLGRKLKPGDKWTVKGQRGDSRDDKGWRMRGSGFYFPLVDRRLAPPRFRVIADTDGAGKAKSSNWKPHTAKDLQEEAARLLKRARRLRRKARAKRSRKEREALGVFDSTDAGYEDELTRLKRVSARMNRLLEQIQTPHNSDTFEGSIARKRYFLKIYKKLKQDAVKIIEAYALRTGNSIFNVFGDGKLDPSIAMFLPPNSVASILAAYSNPTQGRSDETPHDVISGRDAKRIRHSIAKWKALKAGLPPPPPPVYALSDEELARERREKDPRFNKVVARQIGAFGRDRPAVTTGEQALGRSTVHLSVVNPTSTQAKRGLPYEVRLTKRRAERKRRSRRRRRQP